MTDGLEMAILRPVQYSRECPTRIHVTPGTLQRQFLCEDYVLGIYQT